MDCGVNNNDSDIAMANIYITICHLYMFIVFIKK